MEHRIDNYTEYEKSFLIYMEECKRQFSKWKKWFARLFDKNSSGMK